MSLRRVIYTSVPQEDISPKDINDILGSARQNNDQRNVSGLLIYSSNVFIQALEGVPEDVAEILNRIKADTRHHSIEVVTDATVEGRVFEDWSMGFSQSTTEKLASCAEIEGTLDASALSTKLNSSFAFPLMFMQAIVAAEDSNLSTATAA